MAYHIYLYTPLHELSDYFPHLIEHCVLGGVNNGGEYFNVLKYKAESYTYYTCFTLDSNSSLELESFCTLIRRDISDKVIKYESKILVLPDQSFYYYIDTQFFLVLLKS